MTLRNFLKKNFWDYEDSKELRKNLLFSVYTDDRQIDSRHYLLGTAKMTPSTFGKASYLYISDPANPEKPITLHLNMEIETTETQAVQLENSYMLEVFELYRREYT